MEVADIDINLSAPLASVLAGTFEPSENMAFDDAEFELKNEIEPLPPSDTYNSLRVDICALLASRLSSFMTLEANIESTPGHWETCYVLLVPKEYKGGTVMADIEAYIEEKLAGSHLKLKVFYGWVGSTSSNAGDRGFTTKIEPQPPSDAYNSLRVDIQPCHKTPSA